MLRLTPPFPGFALIATPLGFVASDAITVEWVATLNPRAFWMPAAETNTAPSSVPKNEQSDSPNDWQSPPAPWLMLTSSGPPLRAVKSGAKDQPAITALFQPCSPLKILGV